VIQKCRSELLEPSATCQQQTKSTSFRANCITVVPSIDSKSIPTGATPQKGFLSLPPEFRVHIFILALRYSCYGTPVRHSNHNGIEPIKVGDKFKNIRRMYDGRQDIVQKQCVLSQVCRQFYQEVTGEGLVYKLNVFHFKTPPLLNSFFATIKPHHRNQISRVAMDFRVTKHFHNMQQKCFKALADCTALKVLAVRVYFDFSICTRTRGSGRFLTMFSISLGIAKD
jgi:hypothetical protein